MNPLVRLISLANRLDKRGFIDKANQIDYIIIRLAMSMEEARSLLGVSAVASEDEIQRAWKVKALENHPDRGGDEEKMKAINVARDLLMGERKPDRTYTPPTTGPSYHQPKREPNVKKVSFAEAAKEAGVPSGVEWKFVTSTGYSPYLGDTKYAGFVAYGASEDAHIFVGVFHHMERNAFDGTDLDVWKMWVDNYPKTTGIADLAPRAIRKMWGNFHNVKDYNSKITVLKPGITEFNYDTVRSSVAGSIPFKDAMTLMGEKSTTWKAKEKIDVILALGRGEGFSDYNIILIVNSQPYQLSKENAEKLRKQSNLLKVVFGSYYYEDSKKHITKMEKGKGILEYLAKKLEGSEPEELINALKKAAEQMEKK